MSQWTKNKGEIEHWQGIERDMSLAHPVCVELKSGQSIEGMIRYLSTGRRGLAGAYQYRGQIEVQTATGSNHLIDYLKIDRIRYLNGVAIDTPKPAPVFYEAAELMQAR